MSLFSAPADFPITLIDYDVLTDDMLINNDDYTDQ